MRHRAFVVALFVTALLAAVVTLGTFRAQSAGAATASCDISNFKNPDSSLDTTGYLACVAAASANAPKPSADCPTADIELAATADPATVEPGGSTLFTAVSFTPGSTVSVVICSTPVSLGTFTVDSTGHVSQTVTIPAGTTLGAHTIAAVGTRTNGLAQVAYAAVDVEQATTTSTGTLPTTGSDSGKLIAMGAALVLLGGAAIFGSTRARRPATVETD
jgi:LPXTG-motif cell wall-anchored protein